MHSKLLPRIVATLLLTATSFFSLTSTASALGGGQKIYYYVHDHLNGTYTLTDENAEVVEVYDYLPYGTDRVAETTQSKTLTENKFTGQTSDTETGFYYFGARYYDPATGRFQSIDPWYGDLANPQTLNKYSYAINNPLFYIDPTGMYIIESGEVESGDTLSAITSTLNDHYGTDYTYNDIASINNIEDPNVIDVGQTIRVGTLDGWQPPTSSAATGFGYWRTLTTEQKRIFNYHRNFYQIGIPENEADLISSEWSGPMNSIAHNIGTEGNVEYRGRGAREGQQAVYNREGQLVVSPENMGTFDFEAPAAKNLYIPHLIADVQPWIEWGNSTKDSTTREGRIGVMAETYAGRAALDRLGYEFTIGN